MDVLEVAPFLAQKKARGSMHSLQAADEVLLTADSVVILEGKIFGKPADREEAVSMLNRLSGRRHTVITGVCLKNESHERVFAGRSEVDFYELSKTEIAYYLDTCQPYDKAGAYGIQEWLGMCKIRRIEGTYQNVMGLPVDLVYEQLCKWP